MSLVRSGYSALPLLCPSCGAAVLPPTKDSALLDERGWAHVPCDCGKVNVIPFEIGEIDGGRRPKRPSWQMAALWVVIIALIALLIPAIRTTPAAEPPPPSFLTT